jgi:dCMP deaminase
MKDLQLTLTIEGCFDLFHDDHRAFIARCLEQFNKIYGYTPALRVRVMSNEWTNNKGPLHPFVDVKDRIATLEKYLSNNVSTIVEATKASFEYQDRNEFEAEFANTIIAISSENIAKIALPDQRYMTVEPFNRLHTSNFLTLLLSLRDSSRCSVRKVGAILLQNGQIIGQGANTCSCSETNECFGCTKFLEGKITESRTHGCSGLHAEIVALSKITPSQREEMTLICTTAPCLNCAQQIVEAGIKKVIYLDEWRRTSEDQKGSFVDKSGLDLLQANNINVRKAGM